MSELQTERRLTVGLYVDEMASWNSTPEEEYAALEELLTREVFGSTLVRFVTGVRPHEVKDRPTLDLYVIDFGGVACSPGSSQGSVISASLLEAIREMPSTYFLVWSTFSARYFSYELADALGKAELDDADIPPNVLLYPSDLGAVTAQEDAVLTRLRQLLGAPCPAPPQPLTAQPPAVSITDEEVT